MAKLLWRLPTWAHWLIYLLTGYKPVIVLDNDMIEQAYAERTSATIDWRQYERRAKGFRLMKFPSGPNQE